MTDVIMKAETESSAKDLAYRVILQQGAVRQNAGDIFVACDLMQRLGHNYDLRREVARIMQLKSEEKADYVRLVENDF